MRKQPQTTPSGAPALANVFAPQALKFGQRSVDIGDQWGRVYAVVNFPPKVGVAWLARAANLPGVTLALHGLPTDPTALTLALNRSISLTAGNLQAGGNALLVQRLEAQLRDAQELMRKIDQEQQSIFTVGLFLLVTAPDEVEGMRRAKRLEGLLAAAGMRARCLAFRQEEGLRAVGPWGIFPPELRGGSPYQMPSETLAAAFPFSSGGVNHGKGIVLGHDDSGGLALVDRWDLSSDSPTVIAGVTNRNWTILAGSGAGKSHTTKLMSLREWCQGAKIILIDPEREYRTLCANVGGTWVNAVGGDVTINPFQAAQLPVDDTADEGATAVAGQVQRVRAFLDLYLPQLTDIQRALLRRAIMQVYQARGIGVDTDPAAVNPGAWPTLRDLYDYCKAAAAQGGSDADTWSTLAALLEDAATGIDAHIWHGASTPAQDTDFLVIDIHDLQSAEKSVQRAQYLNVLGYAWDIIRRDREERVVLVVDEAWMMIDPQTPQALSFLKEMSKRIRKYAGALTVVSQNAIDFLDPSVAREGEPVLANSSTKFLMRQDAKDLPAVTQLFSLSQAEQDKLASARQGEGLLICGNTRAWVVVDTAPHETYLMYGGR